MRHALFALLLAAPASAGLPEFEKTVLETLQRQSAPVIAPVKAKPGRTLAVADKRSNVCRLKGMSKDSCLYECSDGTEYSQPITVDPPLPSDPLGSPRIACPHLVIRF